MVSCIRPLAGIDIKYTHEMANRTITHSCAYTKVYVSVGQCVRQLPASEQFSDARGELLPVAVDCVSSGIEATDSYTTHP